MQNRRETGSKKCSECSVITEFEKGLEQGVEETMREIKERLGNVVSRYQEESISYYKRCLRPLIGRLTWKKESPPGLGTVYELFEMYGFEDIAEAINEEALELEKMKRKHLSHWGDEVVTVDYPPHTSCTTTRSDAYWSVLAREPGGYVEAPDKYNIRELFISWIEDPIKPFSKPAQEKHAPYINHG